jgi:Fe2+ or Zn2+ uptake regulation protein
MYSKLLINKGLMPTVARIAVLEVLAQHQGLTADDIYMIANKNGELKIGTIYRVLSDLEKYHLIQRVLFGRNKSLYKLVGNKINCNIRNNINGEVQPYHNPEIDNLLEEVLCKLEGEFSAIDLILYK